MDEMNNTPIEGEQAPVTEPAGEQPKTEEKPAEPTFTQEQVNGIVTKESRKQLEKLMQEAGLPVDGDYKEQLAAFKAWTDSQKTEAQLAAEAKTKAETDLANAQAENAALQKQITALGKGIPTDKMAQYTKLAEAYEVEDFGEALDKALADFPLKVETPQMAVPGQTSGGKALSDMDKKRRAMGVII